MRILVVEDDPEMAATIRQGLTGSGFTVDLVHDGRTGLRCALSRFYSVIVLDLMLPEMDGWAVCRELRAGRKATPVLMITARDAVDDRIKGLETGADDYLPKPFDFREFLARVRALIRRDRLVKSGKLRVGELEIDTRHRTVRRAGSAIPLTPLEYEILEILAGQTGRIVPRETLLELVWQDREPGSNKLDVAVRSLRKKIEEPDQPKIVHTVYGFGYTIRSDA